MKKLIACLLAIATLTCLVACGPAKKDDKNNKENREVDGYFTYILQEDGTYSITATNPNDFPEEVTVPSSFNGIPVTALADSAFSSCANLRKITIPDSITRLPYAAFYMCPDLEVINLPRTITGIGKGALSMCEKEITIHFDGTVKEWEGILKASNWDTETEYYVSCSDGFAD